MTGERDKCTKKEEPSTTTTPPDHQHHDQQIGDQPVRSKISTGSATGADVAVRRGGFDKFEHLRAAVRDTGLSHADFRVLSVIWDHANAETMTAFPSRDTIAKHLGLSSPDNLKANVKRIVKAGYLEVVKTGSFNPQTKQNYSTVYRLTLPVTPEDGGVVSTPPVGVESTPPVGVASTPLIDHSRDQGITTTTAVPKAKEGQEDRGLSLGDWKPKAEHRDLSDSRGLIYQAQLTAFREHNANNAPRNWDSTFTRWLELARLPDKPKSKAAPKVGDNASWMNLSKQRPQ